MLHASTQAEPRSGLGLNELLGSTRDVHASTYEPKNQPEQKSSEVPLKHRSQPESQQSGAKRKSRDLGQS